jgi:hypothetical protein
MARLKWRAAYCGHQTDHFWGCSGNQPDRGPPMIIRDVLFVLGCAAGALLAISQYIIMFLE